MDDIFEDLLGPRQKTQPDASSPVAQQQGEIGKGKSVENGSGRSQSQQQEQDATDEAGPQASGFVGVSKEELQTMVNVAVEGAMESMLGKLAKSLRTVSSQRGE